jgi:hypothetical protein
MAALSLPRTVRARRFAVAAVSLLALAGLACGTATADASQARASSVAPARQVVAAGTGCPQSVTGKAASGPLTAAGVSPASWTPAGVPWRSVGRGWILAELAASASASGPQALYLVSPGGQRYRLGTVPAGALLEDWSGNGTDALLLDRKVNSTEESAIVLNLRTGKAGGFALPSGTPYPQISFTRPAGTAVLFLGTASTSGGYLPLQRFSLTGTRQLCYPAQFPRAGSEDGTYRESANGTEIVFATQNGFEVVSNAGQPVRYLAAGNRGYCFLLNWWNSQSVVANCGGGLWTYPLSGAQPADDQQGPWQLPRRMAAAERDLRRRRRVRIDLAGEAEPERHRHSPHHPRRCRRGVRPAAWRLRRSAAGHGGGRMRRGHRRPAVQLRRLVQPGHRRSDHRHRRPGRRRLRDGRRPQSRQLTQPSRHHPRICRKWGVWCSVTPDGCGNHPVLCGSLPQPPGGMRHARHPV